MIEGIFYSRFSPRPAEKAAECESCDSQLRDGCDWSAKNGVRLINDLTFDENGKSNDIYRDECITGASIDRPGLNRALNDLRPGMRFIVRDWDRLARDIMFQAEINAIVERKKCDMWAVMGGRYKDDEDPWVEGVNLIRGVINQIQRKIITKATSKAMKRFHRTGEKYVGGREAYGWKLNDEKILVPVANEWAVIDLIKRLYIEQCKTPQIIGRTLRKNGCTFRGRRFDQKYVKRLIARYENDWTAASNKVK